MIEASPLIIPAFIAGIVTFLAPCTFPLVPAYLSLISGVSPEELRNKPAAALRAKIFLNGLLYVIGFSAVFILMGSLLGLGGSVFFQYREVATQLAGVLVIIFGLLLMIPALKGVSGGRIDLFSLPGVSWIFRERKAKVMGRLRPGNPLSSLVFGGAFALGWSPCVGPILGAILTIAASSGQTEQGAFLLFVFSLGLAIPFLVIAAAVGWATRIIPKMAGTLNWVSLVGGALLVGLGALMATNNFLVWIAKAYEWFEFLNYEEQLLQFL